MAEEKVLKLQKEVEVLFANRTLDLGCTIQNSEAQNEVTDYVYELTFSEETKLKDGNVEDVILTLPEFRSAANKVALMEDHLTRAVTLIEGQVQCRNCKSNNTITTFRQTMGGDEPPTLLVYCNSCGHKTRQTGE